MSISFHSAENFWIRTKKKPEPKGFGFLGGLSLILLGNNKILDAGGGLSYDLKYILQVTTT